MSVVVAIKKDEKIYVGADSQVTRGGTRRTLNKGDTVVILEAMKMEIPVVAPADGTVASVNCSVGDPVEAGALLATLK